MLLRMRTTKATTSDGLCSLNEDVPIGREYLIDVASRRTTTMWNVAHNRLHEKVIVNVVDGDGRMVGWFPLELLCHG